MNQNFAQRFEHAIKAIAVPGDVHTLIARDRTGIGVPETYAGRLDGQLPAWLWHRAAERLETRLYPVSASGRVACLWAVWQLPTVSTDGQGPEVEPVALTRVQDALRTGPRPSALINAGPEWLAVWQLSSPLTVDDARPHLVQLAGALGATVPTPEDNLAAVTLPVCGIIRNFGTLTERRIQIVETSPGAYTASAIVPQSNVHPARTARTTRRIHQS